MNRCSKDEFVKSMTELVEQYKNLDEWIDGLEKCLPGAFESIMEHSFFDYAISLLGTMVGDKYNWIEYYFFERDLEWFEYKKDGKTCEVKSYEDLYDLIVEE